jgi:hypothetical protein
MWFTPRVRSWLLALTAATPWTVSAQWRGERPGPEGAPVVAPAGVLTPSPMVVSPRAFGAVDGAGVRGPAAFRPDSTAADTPSRRGRHARIGALVGGGFGLGVGLLAGAASEGLNADGPDGGKILVATITSTALFALVGAGIGALFP